MPRKSAALAASAKRGIDLFFSEDAECYHCHAGPNFSTSFRSADTEAGPPDFQNNGLYAYTGSLSEPGMHSGIFAVTQQPLDLGKFKPPTLRNIAATAPYMHDGSVATLDEVLDHYASGGREHPTKSTIVRGFTLGASERSDLLAFLNALTDEALLKDPRFADPRLPAGAGR